MADRILFPCRVLGPQEPARTSYRIVYRLPFGCHATVKNPTTWHDSCARRRSYSLDLEGSRMISTERLVFEPSRNFQAMLARSNLAVAEMVAEDRPR